MRRLSIVEFLAELFRLEGVWDIFNGSIRSAAKFVLTVLADVNGFVSIDACSGSGGGGGGGFKGGSFGLESD